MSNYYYGVYESPYCHDGELYVGSPKNSEQECYDACGTDEQCWGAFTFEEDAEAFCRYINNKSIYDTLEEMCNERNLQFNEDWVHIDKSMGIATVQNEYGRILASLHF